MAKFTKGQSGNPKGKPKGSLDWRVKLRKQIEAAAPDLIQRLLAQAESGDVSAIKLLLDKVLPNVKPESAPVTIPLTAKDEAGSITAVIQAMAQGSISLDAGCELVGVLAKLVQVKETSEVLRRIEALEIAARKEKLSHGKS